MPDKYQTLNIILNKFSLLVIMFYIQWTREINLQFPRNTVFVITVTVVLLLLFFVQCKPQVPEALQLPHLTSWDTVAM